MATMRMQKINLDSFSSTMHLGILQMADPAAMRKAQLDNPSGGLYVTHRITTIICGLVSPLVVLSSFPGLTETWRIIPLPDGEVERPYCLSFQPLSSYY